MSAAYCPPNLLATSSYDGELIVWNLVSGHLFCRLQSSVTFESGDTPGWSNHVDTCRFYRAMHYSAKRGIEIACCLSVCLSVSLPFLLYLFYHRTGRLKYR